MVSLPLISASILQTRANTIALDNATTYQTIEGFGFSEAFGHAQQIYNLEATVQKKVLDILFNTTTGAGLTILRNIITTGDIEPTAPDSSTATPAYTWDGSDGEQVWLSQQAASYDVETIYANAWSAPAFMKTNDAVANGGYLCGVYGESCSTGSWIQAYANYLTQYVRDYKSAGVDISHLGFLNEPDSTTSYDSMLSDGTQAAEVISVLRTTLDAAGYTSVKINCCDGSGWTASTTQISEAKAAGGTSHMGVATSHGYSSAPDTPFDTSLPVWQSEWADLTNPWTTDWSSTGTTADGLVWAQRIQSGLIDSNLSAFLYWVGAEPTDSASSAMLVQFSSTDIDVSGRLWAFAHFGRFVRPGAVRISATSSTSGVTVSAFRNVGGALSLQIINNGASGVAVSVSGFGGVTAVQPVLSSAGNEFVFQSEIAVSDGEFVVTVPGLALMSFVPS